MRKRRRGRSWSLFLPLVFWTAIPARALPPTGGSNGSGGAPTRCFTEAETEALIEDLRAIAAEEIERTAGEAAKAAALEYAPELAAAREAAEEWEAEAVRLGRTVRRGGLTAVLAGVSAFGLGFLAGGVLMAFTGGAR
jgi:hypothetical protein